MPFADGAFDYAVCSHVLEHVSDPAAVAAELSRVARAGYVEVPEAASAKILDFPSHVWWCRLDGSTLVFTPKSARAFDPEIGDYIERAGIERRLDRLLDSEFDAAGDRRAVARPPRRARRGARRPGVPRPGAGRRRPSPRWLGARCTGAHRRAHHAPSPRPVGAARRSATTTSSSPSYVAATGASSSAACTASTDDLSGDPARTSAGRASRKVRATPADAPRRSRSRASSSRRPSGSSTSIPGPPWRARRRPSPADGRGGWRGGHRAGRRADRLDAQAVVGLDDVGAGPGQLGGEVAEAVALLGPDEPDPADRRRRRRGRGDDRQRRHEVRDVGHVDVDADERRAGVASDGGATLVDRSTVQPIASSSSAKAPSPCGERRCSPATGHRHRPQRAAIASG